MEKFPYRLALITGGSSGIGFAIAEYLVVRGTDVIIVSRDLEKLQAARLRLLKQARQGVRVEVLQLDVSERPAVEEGLGGLILAGNVPDLLINCAGMAHPDYFEGLDPEIFDRTLAVNLTGTWNVLKNMVPAMKPGSHIVNVSSVCGFLGFFGYTAYSASKFGIIGLSEALRNELSLRGIGVSVLCPPDTDTPQLEQENRTKPPEARAISGNAGILQPGQVAESLFQGLKRKKFIIIPGLMARLTFLVKRLFPGIIFFIIDTDAKKVNRRKIDEKN